MDWQQIVNIVIAVLMLAATIAAALAARDAANAAQQSVVLSARALDAMTRSNEIADRALELQRGTAVARRGGPVDRVKRRALEWLDTLLSAQHRLDGVNSPELVGFDVYNALDSAFRLREEFSDGSLDDSGAEVRTEFAKFIDGVAIALTERRRSDSYGECYSEVDAAWLDAVAMSFHRFCAVLSQVEGAGPPLASWSEYSRARREAARHEGGAT